MLMVSCQAHFSEFIEWYKTVQSEFLGLFDNISMDDYKNYNAKLNDTTVNAGMKWLNDDKKEFLIEKFEDHLCDFKFL